MTTPYPFVSTGVSTAVSTAVSSSTSSEAASDSSPSSLSSHTSSDSSDTIRPYKHNVLKPASPAQLIEPESNHQLLPPKAIDVPRQVSRPSLKHPHEDIRLARHRLLSRNDPVLEPRFPTRRNDFPGKPAQGDPNTTNKSEYSPVDGPRWSDEEYYGVLAAALARKYPPDLDGMAAARARNAPLFSKRQHHLAVAENDVSITTTANNTATTTAAGAPPRPLQGFFHTLDLLKEIKRGNRAEFGAWSAARGRLEEGLADRAGRLQADFAAHVERVWRAQHARRHGRVSDGEYQAAKRRHMDEMRGLLRAAHDVAIAMGVLYAERAAVAQGAVPRHGENWGKLDLTACDPLPYVHRLFPDFVPQRAGPPPDEMAPANPVLPVQPGVLDTETLREAWGARRGRLAPLHAATFEARWYDVLYLSRDGDGMAERVLAGGSWQEDM